MKVFLINVFLRKQRNINKNYYWGYIYNPTKKNNKMVFFDKFKYLKKCYEYFLSEKFKHKIINLTGKKICIVIEYLLHAEENSF